MGEIDKISNITVGEYAELIASWHYHTNKRQYNCKSQISELIKKKNSAGLIESFKQRNGCDGRISDNPRQIHGPVQFHDCYCNHLDPGFISMVKMSDYFSKGYLPYSGSILEQPNKAMEAINLIEQLKQELQEKTEKKNAKR